MSVSELSRKYSLSKGTLYRIKHDARLISRPEATRRIFGLNRGEEETLIEWVREFFKSHTWQFNAKDVHNHIMRKLGKDLPLYHQKSYETHFNLVYKRVNSRPCNIKIDKLQLARILFSIRLSNNINSDTLLINIDETSITNETSITKETKSNSSWTPIGKNAEILIRKFVSSLNIVFAIF